MSTAYIPNTHWHETTTGEPFDRLPADIAGRIFQPCTERAVHRAYERIQAATCTTLEHALERLATLAHGRKTLDVPQLPADLGIVSAPKQRLGHGSYHPTEHRLVLEPHTPVVVRQTRLTVDQVATYIRQLARGEAPYPITVTDRPGDGQLWHVNGLHRLIAARLLGYNVPAAIWR